ncbi:DUF4880 domain-containing protein [Achromobacter xylosoxidans]
MPEDALTTMGMPPQRGHGEHAVLEQAAQWFALLQSEEATATDREAWRRWCDSAEAHRAAWAQVERVGQLFRPIQTAPDPHGAVGAYRAATANATRRRVVLGLALVAGAGLTSGVAWRYSPLAGLVPAWPTIALPPAKSGRSCWPMAHGSGWERQAPSTRTSARR